MQIVSKGDFAITQGF